MEIVLVCFIMFFIFTSLFGAFLLKRSVDINNSYVEFYENTLMDVEAVIALLEELMHKRQLITDDPDIRNLYRVLGLIRDVLAGYSNAIKKSDKKRGVQ